MKWKAVVKAVDDAVDDAATIARHCSPKLTPAPFVCANGLAELIGEIVLICTGGTPTPQGETVLPVNIQVFLNTNVTGRLLQDPWTEALLLIDEPLPSTQHLCGAAGGQCTRSIRPATPQAVLCASPISV